MAYLFGILGGIVIYLIESKNKFVRFNAMQSILLGAAYIVIMVAWVVIQIILPDVLGCLIGMVMPVVGLAYFVLSIVLMIKSYQGEKFKLPIIGDMAEKQA